MLIQSDAAHTKTSSNPHKPLKFNDLHFKLITGSRRLSSERVNRPSMRSVNVFFGMLDMAVAPVWQSYCSARALKQEILAKMGIHFTQVPPMGCGFGTSPPARTR